MTTLGFLVEKGVEDPDVDMYIAILNGDHDALKNALERGADPNISLGTVLSRHREILNKMPPKTS